MTARARGDPGRSGRGRVDSSNIEKVKDATDIVALVGRYVQLKKSGRSFRGLCPFHSEKTPSFYVSPERQAYHCFGCGAGGDSIAFLMDFLNLSFRDALEELAEESGVAISFDRRHSERNDVLRTILAETAEHFRRALRSPGGRRAMDYLLKERGFTAETVESLGLGWAAAGNGLTDSLREKGYSDSLLVDSGVALRSERSGRICDRFRERVVFPIRSRRGYPVSFGGRALSSDTIPKYINGPDTPVYNKGYILYGFRAAAEAARSADMIILVEGYFDHARLLECGYAPVVATCGTALTPAQARQLVGAASDIFIAYDGDESGRLAASRASEVIIAEGGYPFILPLAEGEDPDSFLLSRGAGAFGDLMTGALDPVTFRTGLDPAMREDARESRRIGMVQKLVEFSCQARDPIVRETLLRKVSEKTGYSMDSLLDEVRALEEATAGSRGRHGAPSSPGAATLPAWDRSILQALLSSAEGLSEPLLDYIEPDDLSNETARALLDQLKGQAVDGYSGPVLSRLSGETRACCAELMSGGGRLADEDRTKIRKRVASARRKRRIAELRTGIGSASPEEKERIVREISALTREGDD